MKGYVGSADAKAFSIESYDTTTEVKKRKPPPSGDHVAFPYIDRNRFLYTFPLTEISVSVLINVKLSSRSTSGLPTNSPLRLLTAGEK